MAAKAVNSMDDVRQAIKMLEEKISKSYELSLRRRRETECYVQQCRGLLKPWPLKSGEKSGGNRQGSELLQTTQDVETNTESTQVESKAKEVESQELAALENLLAKAQKTREVQAKLDEAEAKAKQEGKISKKPLLVTSKPPQKKPVQQITKQNLSKASKPPPKRPASVTKPGLRKPAMKSTYSSAFGRFPSAKSPQRPKSSRGSANKYLESVLKKDDRRGTHSKLDLKEGGNVPSRTGPGPGSGGRNIQTSKTTTDNTGEEQGSNARKISKELLQEESKISSPSWEESVVSSKLFEKADSVNRSAENLADFGRASVIEKSEKPKSVTGIPGQSLGLPKPGDSFNTEEIDVHDKKEDSFDPLVEGVELALPGKYRKLKATSVRLYSEVRKIAEKDDSKSSLPWHNFVERLEGEFKMGYISTHKEIKEKSKGLLEEHERLSLLTSAVVARSNDLKDDSSWQEVYKCYRHWQIVLSKFNELQKRTQQLLEVEEQLNERCPCGNCGMFDRDRPRDTSIVREEWNKGCVLLSRWIPKEIHDCASAQSCAGLDQQCGSIDFTYSSVKELRELVGLHHDVQLLCLELHVKQFVGERLLPLLEKMDPFDRNSIIRTRDLAKKSVKPSVALERDINCH